MKHHTLILTSLATFGLLASTAFAQEPAETKQPTKAKGVAFRALPVVKTDDQSHFLLPMNVDGADSHFLLDTGCGYSVVVSLEQAKSLKKDLGKAHEMGGIGGSSEAYEATFDQFKLGGVYAVQFANTHVVDMSDVDAFTVEEKPVKVQGMVGSLTLMALRGVFDTKAGHILVPPTDSAKGLYQRSMKSRGAVVLPMAKKAYARPYIEAKVKDKSYLFLIDTAANTNLIEPEVARELGLELSETSVTVVGKGEGAVQKAFRTKVKDVMLADKVKLTEVSFTVVASKGFDEEGVSYGGIIGVQVLNALNAQLDFDTYSLIIPQN